ncbi:MAG: GDP-fucose synthetase [Acidobacteria bacterium]|nr:MAG: GDP-fucose synthetase [Acidobacteriota bacterium]
MINEKRIFIAGHRGLVGSAILRRLRASGCSQVITRTRNELDLTNQAAVNLFFEKERPELVFLAAARVGGILANNIYRADFIRDNLLIQTNVIDAAFRSRVERLVFLGSSCIYPKHAPQPIKEEYLLTGPLEPTNEPYAIAKIAGLKMCQAFGAQYGFDCISIMPTNLYGPRDDFDLQSSHVLAALIRKFHEARVKGYGQVEIWGTGQPRREFLYVDDLADACIFLAERRAEALDAAAPDRVFNVGVGDDLEIRELAALIQEVVETKCELVFDTSKPDGTPRKLLDVSRMKALGWTAQTPLSEGIRKTYEWFVNNESRYTQPDELQGSQENRFR